MVSVMEQEIVSCSREERQLGGQVPEYNDKALPEFSKKCSTNSQRGSLSCSHICSFSTQEYGKIDSAERSKSKVKLSGLVIFYFIVMVAEIVGGLKANSLAVLTDAGHLLSDIAGLSISLFTVWVSGWKSTPQQSFGFNRLEVLGALLSVQLIWLVSGALIYEAIDRILHKKTKINGPLMFGVAAFGFLVNVIMIFWLGHEHSHHCHSHSHEDQHGHESEHHHSHELEELHSDGNDTAHLVPTSPTKIRILNINIQGAYLHVITDLIQSAGVMITGCIIWLKPEWLLADLICTILFSIFALTTTIPMLKDIFSILMERTPDEIDIPVLENGLKGIKGLHDVHDLHVWAITSGKFVLSCHVVIDPGSNPNEILNQAREYCENDFHIHHVTIQIEQDV